jgi:hypothetical protein
MKGALFFCFLAGCSSSSDPTADLAMDAASSLDLSIDKSARCASTFGSALTAPYGRLDGTVLAVLPPNDQACPMPNSDHLILEVTSGGAVYRMVVNVQSDRGTDLRVFFGEKSAPLAGPTYAGGWHTNAPLDYALTLGATKSELSPLDMADLVSNVTERIPLDAKVSVFGSTAGGASAHLIHRNVDDTDGGVTPDGGIAPIYQDGAIVLLPDSESPQYLLFAFAEDSF